MTVPDRLARRYAYQVLLVEEFTRCGCEVIFVQHGLGTSPEEQMLLQMQGVLPRSGRSFRNGHAGAACLRRGKGVNWGNPPYGYTYIRKTPTIPQHLVVNEAEAEVVRLIYRWCVEEQMSSYAIQRRLTAQGIVPCKARHGRWAQSSIIEILRDSLYKVKPITTGPKPPMRCRMAGAAARTACLAIAKGGHGGRRASGLLSRCHPSSIWRPGSGRKGTPTEPGTRPTPYDAPSLFVTQSPGLWTLRPADGGPERPGRALHLCPPLSAPCARRVRGAQPGGADHRADRVGARANAAGGPGSTWHQYEQGAGIQPSMSRPSTNAPGSSASWLPWSGRKPGSSTPIKPRSLS